MATAPAHVDPDLVVEFDLYDDRLAADFNNCTRDLPPVCYTLANDGHWIISGYDRISKALRDPATFASWPASLPSAMGAGRGRFIPLEYDPPEQTAYRQILLPHFSPGRVSQLEPVFRDLATQLLDGFTDRGHADFMDSFARPFPAMMFLGLMGWPLDKMREFCGWVDGFQHGGGGSSEDQPVQLSREQSVAAAYGYFAEFVEARRSEPLDDITTALVQARLPDGRALTDAEILSYIFLLLIAGLHTVESALAFGVMFFSQNPDERDRVIKSPETLGTAMEELLRWEPPAWGTARVVAKETEIAGVRLLPGDKVLLPHQAGNRDPYVFRDADTFNPTRAPNAHLSFGAGPHRCIGMHLARMELRIAFDEIHKRIPDYRLDPAHPPVQHMSQVRGVESLRIVFTPEAAKR